MPPSLAFALTLLGIAAAFIMLGAWAIAASCRRDPDEGGWDERGNGDQPAVPRGLARTHGRSE